MILEFEKENTSQRKESWMLDQYVFHKIKSISFQSFIGQELYKVNYNSLSVIVFGDLTKISI